MLLYIWIFFIPVLRDVDSYMKVYAYFTIYWTKCVQDTEAITVITVHDFPLFICVDILLKKVILSLTYYF